MMPVESGINVLLALFGLVLEGSIQAPPGGTRHTNNGSGWPAWMGQAFQTSKDEPCH